jgi:hypothetical protein
MTCLRPLWDLLIDASISFSMNPGPRGLVSPLTNLTTFAS